MPDTARPDTARPDTARPESVLDELELRGIIAQTTSAADLAAALSGGPVTYYCGFDPTAPSLHIGNLVQLITMRRIQRAGHLPLGLVGGATGLIGDPRMSGERLLNSAETVAGWAEKVREQVERYLDFEGTFAARIVNNLDWTARLGAIEFLRDIGKHFRMGRMLGKEIVARRLASDEGLSFTEFSYQILQGMDFLQLYRRYGCTLQTGGSDQWGNLTSGTELIHKVEGRSVHALATPLLTKADGTKFGKTESGTVWLDAQLTSPYAFYQFWFNSDDRDVGTYLKIMSNRPPAELAELDAATADRPHAREAQRALAAELTTLVHGQRATDGAVAAGSALFGRGDLAAIDEPTLAAALREAGLTDVSGEMPDIAHLLVTGGLASSLSDARRTVGEGGANINNRRVADHEYIPGPADLLHGRYLVLRRGRRAIAGIRIGD